jgi:DnaJ-class molecular chaperone
VSFDEAFFGMSYKLNYGVAKTDDDKIISYTQPVFVRIPPGYKGGSLIYEDRGMEENGKKGNLIVHVVVGKHMYFTLDTEGNIHLNARVPLDIMLKGGEEEVPTMYGVARLQIPPASQPGDVLEIKNKGKQKLRSQFVKLSMRYPNREDLNKKVWQRFMEG